VLLFEMLTGALPFASSEPAELIYSHLARTPPSPHQLRREIPEVLSALVLKLLSKAAEDRYQSAHALLLDLRECLSQWVQGQHIAEFPLGRFEKRSELRLPQRLYGRDAAGARLAEALTRVQAGAVELVLLHGPAGVGKSALAMELHLPVVKLGGFFASGRATEQLGGRPFAPLLAAGRALVCHLLTLSPRELGPWQQRLHEALGPLGSLLLEAIPELERVIGSQPAVAKVGPQEAQNRFVFLFQNFLRAFASKQHPVVLFLDDLQDADAATIGLLRQIVTDPGAHHLLVIGAYRPADVGANHPLRRLTAAGAAPGQPPVPVPVPVPVHDLAVEDLALADVAALLGDALDTAAPQLMPLAEEVHRKTHGNPFFVRQFLKSLAHSGALAFDEARGAWVWDLAQVRSALMTDNVAAFMTNKLQRLRAPSLQILSAAACIGYEFDLRQLSLAADAPVPACAAALTQAMAEELAEELIGPLRGDFGLQPAASGAEAAPWSATLGDDPPRYRFMHERVHLAVYKALAADERQRVHLRIGQALQAQGSAEGQALFELVGHLNAGRALLYSEAARRELAELDLVAGERTMATGGFAAAAELFAIGVELLGEAGWNEAPELCFKLHLLRAQSVTLSGAHDQAEEYFQALGQRPLVRLQRAMLCVRHSELCYMRGDFARSLAIGLSGVELFGIHLPGPGEDRQRALLAELAEVGASLGDRRIAELIDAPRITDPELYATMLLLSGLNVPVFVSDPGLFPFVLLRQVILSLRHGHSEESDYQYACYAFFLAGPLGRIAEGAEWARLALALNRRDHNARTASRVHMSVSSLWHYLAPLRETVPLLESARRAALESGDFAFLSAICFGTSLVKFDLSDDLNLLLKEAEQDLQLVSQAKDMMGAVTVRILRQALAALLGKTAAPSSLSDGEFDEEKVAAELAAQGLGSFVVLYLQKRLLLDYLLGPREATWELAMSAEQWEAPMAGFKWSEDLWFLACLTLLALLPTAAPAQRRAAEARIERYYARSVMLARQCPQNYAYRERLLAAERARSGGRAAEAMMLYDEAVAAVQAADFPIFEALTCERAATFHHEGGRSHLATFYLTDAYYTYARLGAAPKASALLANYPQLIRLENRGLEPVRPVVLRTTTATSSSSRGTSEEHLDVNAILNAARAIAYETELERVIEQVMRIVGASAGAQHTALLLEHKGALYLEAMFHADADTVQLGLSVPVQDCADLPQSIVHYVARTRELVALDSACTDARYAMDPYIDQRKPRSVLCLPLEHRGRLSGLLYLENNLTPDVFSRARVDLLRILATQAAISVENALLLLRTEEAAERVRRTNEVLESQVAQRTSELESKNSELLTVNQRLQEEFAQRSRLQQARLAELSTPLIPITDRIVVMPLIGTLDRERAAQVLEAALDGAQRLRVQVMILDITGLKQADTSTAEMLVRTAAALGMLGTRSILTGIRSDVAQTLVALGSELGKLETRSNLQSGIAHAMEMTGTRLGWNARSVAAPSTQKAPDARLAPPRSARQKVV
jgi:predicted ATPase/GAF domain-containing protein/ABC-type transporter Mla MlaB component